MTRRWIIWLLLLTWPLGRASAQVTASVDRNRIAFGESVVLTIAINGVQGGVQPAIPAVDGLTFQGPSQSSSISIINGQRSQSVSLSYQVTPARMGRFTIPGIEVQVGNQKVVTQPITITVEKGAVQDEQRLYAKIDCDRRPIFLGETVPVKILLYAREDFPVKGFAGFQCAGDGVGFKNLDQVKQGRQVINGEGFNVYIIEGALTPLKAGAATFGPCAVRCQVQVQRQRGSGNDFFDQFMGRIEVREVPITTEPLPVEVLPLPAEGRPADFNGAVGQWKMEVTAKPTAVNVGDPVTLTIKISGAGVIVPEPKFTGLEEFKTYEPTSKTTKDDLNTRVERDIQQVLIARNTTAKQLPEIRLSYFDPVSKAYLTAVQPAIPLTVKAGSGASTVVGGARARGPEKLGEDIVYLKGDLGPQPVSPLAPVIFWALNALPVIALLGSVAWKRRADRLRGDVAYARRSRAAKRARKLLAEAGSHEQIQHALQAYLGDRLNIPVSGITVSVVEEQLLPRGVAAALADEVRKCFETCDAARFAGVGAADVVAMRQTVERVIDELENAKL